MGYSSCYVSPPPGLSAGFSGAMGVADRAKQAEQRKRYAAERGTVGTSYRGLETVTAGGMAGESGIMPRSRQQNAPAVDGQRASRPGYLGQRPGAADIRLEDWNTLGVASRNAISSTATSGGDITAAIKEQADRASADRKRDWLIRSRAVNLAVLHGITMEEAVRRVIAKLQAETIRYATDKGVAYDQARAFAMAWLESPDF